MKIIYSLQFLIIVSLCFSISVNGSTCFDRGQEVNFYQVIGEARHPKTGELLYCEYHQEKENQIIVDYLNEERPIAQKVLDFSHSLSAPSVSQNDFRHGEVREAKYISEGNYALLYRPPDSAQSQQLISKSLAPKKDLVIDAGFDFAVRENWDGLIKGNTIKLPFLLPTRLNTMTLSVKEMPIEKCYKEDKATSMASNNLVCLWGQSNYALINAFVAPIRLIYDKNNKKLVRFFGRVNITNDKGRSQSAIIDYYYLSQEAG